MIWLGLYPATALVVGAAIFVLVEFHRAPGTPAPQRPGLSAIAAGFLWPVIVVGAAQCALLLAIRHQVLHAATERVNSVPTLSAH